MDESSARVARPLCVQFPCIKYGVGDSRLEAEAGVSQHN
jgi:hypothetical protein